MLKFLIFISVIAINSAANKTERAKRWVNENNCGIAGAGSESQYINHGQWPFVAAVFEVVDGRAYFMCGATIISKHFILTGLY